MNEWLKDIYRHLLAVLVSSLEFQFLLIQFHYTIAQGKHRAMLYISKAFKTEQQQQTKMNTNI